MNRILTIVAIVLTSFTLRSQTNVYHEFPDSNAFWNITATACCWADCGGPPTPNPIIHDSWYSNYIAGDTVINSTSYHKLYKSGSTYEHCAVGPNGNWFYYDYYVGAFREDTSQRKVFMVYPSSINEMVWLDFGVGVGDTICPWDPCTIVTSIDSTLIGSNYRKKFNVNSSASFFVIEGIGTTAGNFDGLCPFESSAILDCFTHDGQALYPDTNASCALITEVLHPLTLALSMTVVPNPLAGDGKLLTSRYLQNVTILVVNSIGQNVLQMDRVSGNVISLPTDELQTGLYLFQVIENNNVIGTTRVIVEE
jgi:hypothetical protein